MTERDSTAPSSLVVGTRDDFVRMDIPTSFGVITILLEPDVAINVADSLMNHACYVRKKEGDS